MNSAVLKVRILACLCVLIGLNATAMAQVPATRTISGVVLAEHSETVAGATVATPDAASCPIWTTARLAHTRKRTSFVDPNFGLFGIKGENDEHPPTDIQRGQAFVSQVVNAVRSGPYWKDSSILITYDEHGGSYDHVHPPKAQHGIRTPDGIEPGQCADLSNPPASLQPGGGAECSTNLINPGDNSAKIAQDLCPELALDPTGPYPASCASFDQLGIRVPFIAISPFSKPHYVSHRVGDHTSILALIETRFLKGPGGPQHLTLRDQMANDLEDMFDFKNAPSMNTTVTQAAPPAVDCTPQ